MKYTKTQFLKDVAAEAKALKKNATKEELGRLDFSRLDYERTDRCIYGQMAKDCRSRRAIELITNCCTRFIKQGGGFIPNTFEKAQLHVNGKESPTPSSIEHLSTVEVYIALPESNPANLIAYLRGERKDLVL